jgi:hypothetical protein
MSSYMIPHMVSDRRNPQPPSSRSSSPPPPSSPPRERKTVVDWGHILLHPNNHPSEADAPPHPDHEVTQQNTAHRIPPDYEAHYLANLFSRTECAALIAASEDTTAECGYGTTNYPRQYRGNLRLIVTDLSLTAAVWDRVRPFVPATVVLHGSQWEAVGLNECWRLSKYLPGDRFQGHCDANFVRNADEMSMFTLNAYMNDVGSPTEDLGGRTRFYRQNAMAFQCVPRAGDCLLFRQPPGANYFHDGEGLKAGVKYLFRSDVMYRKLAPAPFLIKVV